MTQWIAHGDNVSAGYENPPQPGDMDGPSNCRAGGYDFYISCDDWPVPEVGVIYTDGTIVDNLNGSVNVQDGAFIASQGVTPSQPGKALIFDITTPNGILGAGQEVDLGWMTTADGAVTALKFMVRISGGGDCDVYVNDVKVTGTPFHTGIGQRMRIAFVTGGVKDTNTYYKENEGTRWEEHTKGGMVLFQLPADVDTHWKQADYWDDVPDVSELGDIVLNNSAGIDVVMHEINIPADSFLPLVHKDVVTTDKDSAENVAKYQAAGLYMDCTNNPATPPIEKDVIWIDTFSTPNNNSDQVFSPDYVPEVWTGEPLTQWVGRSSGPHNRAYAINGYMTTRANSSTGYVAVLPFRNADVQGEATIYHSFTDGNDRFGRMHGSRAGVALRAYRTTGYPGLQVSVNYHTTPTYAPTKSRFYLSWVVGGPWTGATGSSGGHILLKEFSYAEFYYGILLHSTLYFAVVGNQLYMRSSLNNVLHVVTLPFSYTANNQLSYHQTDGVFHGVYSDTPYGYVSGINMRAIPASAQAQGL